MMVSRSIRTAALGVAAGAMLLVGSAAHAVSFTSGNVIATLGNFRTAGNQNSPTYELDMNLGPQSGLVPGFTATFALPAQALAGGAAGSNLVAGSIQNQSFGVYSVPDPNRTASIFFGGVGPFDTPQANILFSSPTNPVGGTSDNQIESAGNAIKAFTTTFLPLIGTPANQSSGVFLNPSETAGVDSSYGSQLAAQGLQQLNGTLGRDIDSLLSANVTGTGDVINVFLAIQGFQDLDPQNPATQVSQAFQLRVRQVTIAGNGPGIEISIVPEPISAALLGAGLLGLALVGQRRRSA
jgi:hypothetical protein